MMGGLGREEGALLLAHDRRNMWSSVHLDLDTGILQKLPRTAVAVHYHLHHRWLRDLKVT